MTSSATKERILDIAKRRLLRGGVSQLSMRAIASDLGYTPMALYRHFPGKAELMDALSQDALGEWQRRLESIHSSDSFAWLSRMFEKFLGFALDSPARFEAAFLLAAPKARQFPDDVAARRSPTLSMMMDRIEHAQRDGAFSASDTPEAIAMTFWALAQGLVTLFRAGRFASEREFKQFYRKAAAHCIASFRR